MVLIVSLGLFIICLVAFIATITFLLQATLTKGFPRLLSLLGYAAVSLIVFILSFNPLWQVMGQFNANFGGGRPGTIHWLPVVLAFLVWCSVLLLREVSRKSQ